MAEELWWSAPVVNFRQLAVFHPLDKVPQLTTCPLLHGLGEKKYNYDEH